MRALLLLFGFLLLAGPAGAVPFANSRLESVAGVELHVRHWPAAGPARGCPVLLLHGLGGSTFSFRELAPALAAAGHPVWALDLPAYGYSARRPFPDTAGAALAPWLRAQAGEQAWCLLGHSMGTRVVAELVLALPGRVAAVAYVAGNPIPSARELRGREPRAEEVAGYLAPLQTPGTALAIMNGYAARWPETPRGEQLDRVPSLILWGEHDAWVKPEVADRLQAALPSARRVTVAGAGHCPMETHAGPTAEAVLAHFGAGPALVQAAGNSARR